MSVPHGASGAPFLRGGWITVKNINKVAVVAAVVFLLSGLALSQTAFTLVQVPGAIPDSSIAVNNNGLVMVNSGNQVSVWNRLSGVQSLVLSGTNNTGAAINTSGEVVGTGADTNIPQAFLWQPSAGVNWLGSLGGEWSAAYGINDSGAVVGFSLTSANLPHAFLWTPAGAMQDLTPDLISTGGATARAINSTNQVVGYYFPNGSSNTLGFLWTQNAGLQNLGAAGTLAFAINDSGTVVGQTPVAKGYRHAFSWTEAAGINDLGTLGAEESAALSINNPGWIVGTSLTSNGSGLQHPFLWMPSKGMQDLDNITPHFAGNDRQTYAVQVNDSGVIAISTNKGGYLLIPAMTMQIASSQNPSVLGQPVTFTVTMTSIAGPPANGETVQFVVNGSVMGSATLTGGVAQFTTSALPVGHNSVIAKYSGDANYLAAKSSTLTQVVDQ